MSEPERALRGLLEELAHDAGPMLFRVAVRVLGDAQRAEDACQQAFVKACEQDGRQTWTRTRLRAWLIRVTLNESLQILRRRRLEQRVHCGDEPGGLKDTAAALPDQHLSDREQVELGLGELDPTTRAVVVLRTMQGESGNQTSALLGISASEVSRRLHRGMNQLRWTIGDQASKDAARSGDACHA